MTTVLSVPDAGCTYDFFRCQLLCLLTQAQERGHDEAQLRAEFTEALRRWRVQGYPSSWLLQARTDVLSALSSNPASRPPACGPANEPDARGQ